MRPIEKCPPPMHGPQAGRLLMKTLLLLSIAGVALGISFAILAETRETSLCRQRLIRIYRALETYELKHLSLPVLAFYPYDPLEGRDSLWAVLKDYGLDDAELCKCPALPASVRDKGQGFIWNAAMNGQPIARGTEPVWLLVELPALSGQLPAPHWSGFHVLYSDGSVRSVKNPLNALPGLR